MTHRAQRFTIQQQQEEISRAQLHECISAFGWVLNPMMRDLGEDIITQIYDSNRWSGLAFYIQLKSTKSLEKLRLKTEPKISYGFSVKDLIHWADASLPIVLMVWDIIERKGVWITVSEALKSIDKPINEIKGKKINIHIPINNSTDKEGLQNLRVAIANYAYPVVAKDKSLDLLLDLHIPTTTPEGREFVEKLEKFWDEGGEFVIPPEFIRDLQTSDWHKKLYGGVQFSQEAPIFVQSRASEKTISGRIDVFTPSGEPGHIPYVELKAIKAGSKRITLSNRHQSVPLHITITLTHEGSSELSIALLNPGINVQETLDILTFLEALNTPNSHFRFTPFEQGQVISFEVPYSMQQPANEEFISRIRKLCFIQNATGVALTLNSFELDGETGKDIEDVFEIVNSGKLEIDHQHLLPTFSKPIVELALEAAQTGMALTYSNYGAETTFTILGSEINLGSADWNIVAIPELSVAELQALLSSMSDDETAPVGVYAISGTAVFDKWKHQR